MDYAEIYELVKKVRSGKGSEEENKVITDMVLEWGE